MCVFILNVRVKGDCVKGDRVKGDRVKGGRVKGDCVQTCSVKWMVCFL
jgi:hypothetical protein